MTRKQQRLSLLALGMAALAAATALVLVAFNDNLVFFYSPSDLAEKAVGPERRIRIGGLVETNSLAKQADGHAVAFRVTDGKTELRVVYDGILPDLFREGQGVVAEGKLRDGVAFALFDEAVRLDQPADADAALRAHRFIRQIARAVEEYEVVVERGEHQRGRRAQRQKGRQQRDQPPPLAGHSRSLAGGCKRANASQLAR